MSQRTVRLTREEANAFHAAVLWLDQPHIHLTEVISHDSATYTLVYSDDQDPTKRELIPLFSTIPEPSPEA